MQPHTYLQVMNIADPDKKLSYVEQCQGQPLTSVSMITCMTVINLMLDEVCVGGGGGGGRIAGVLVGGGLWRLC